MKNQIGRLPRLFLLKVSVWGGRPYFNGIFEAVGGVLLWVCGVLLYVLYECVVVLLCLLV